MIKRLVTWAALLILAVLLALWLKDAVQDQLITPLAYLIWLLGLYLRSVSASVYWAILLGAVALIILLSLLGGLRFQWRAREKRVRIQGPVEQAAALVRGTRRLPYFRWLVARRLGELARSIVMAPDAAAFSQPVLRGTGSAPPPHVQAFLEAGLDRPPADRGRGRLVSLKRAPGTGAAEPLGGANVEQVIEYLESQMEIRE